MKRVGFLYEKIIDKDNIRNAIIMSSKGKLHRRDVRGVYFNIDYYVEYIHKILVEEKWEPAPYKLMRSRDSLSKKRKTN